MSFNNKSNLMYLWMVILCAMLMSCASNRNLVYFSNLPAESDYSEPLSNTIVAQIQPGDLMGITISTINPEYNQLLNTGTLPTTSVSGNTNPSNTVVNNLAGTGYMVDTEGYVNLPVLGRIALAGLTKEEARKKITDEVAKTAKNPIVNVRFLNYKVTVVGEVARPGSFIVPDEKINVLEALGLAGDMTAYGIRDNVIVIREKNGARTVKSLNLNKKEVFQSQYFQLQQNDVVYVLPANKEKMANTNAAINYPKIAIGTAIISAIAVVVATLIK